MRHQPAHTLGALLGGIIVAATLTGTRAPERLEAASVDPCRSITPKTMRAYARTIEAALRSAEADVRANGQGSAYPEAPAKSRDVLVRARDRINEGVTFLEANTPQVTDYAEAGKVKEYTRNSLDWMTLAGHWALISATWNHSSDAHDAFEGIITAIGEGQHLFAESGRCFMSNYL